MAATPFTKTADHSTVLTTAVTSGTYPNIVNGCEECHKLDTSTTPNTDYSTNGTSTGAIIDAGSDNPRVHDTCSSCHKEDGGLKGLAEIALATRGRMVSGYAPGHGAGSVPNLDSPTNCFSCHGTDPGLVHLNHDHTNTVGNTPACNWCHSEQVGQANGASVDPNNNMVHDACVTCHTISKGVAGDFSVGLVNPANLTHVPALVSTMVTPTQKGSPVNCTDCHAVHLFNEHQHADHTMVVQTSTEGCTNTCHIDADGNSGTVVAGEVTGFGMNISTSDNKIHDDCTSCHNTTTGGLRTVAEVNTVSYTHLTLPTIYSV